MDNLCIHKKKTPSPPPPFGSGSLNEAERKLSCSVKLDKWDSAVFAAKMLYDPVWFELVGITC